MQRAAQRPLVAAATGLLAQAGLGRARGSNAGTCPSTAGRPMLAALKIVFLGAPGSGKGTYSSRIASILGLPHISAGQLLREEVDSGSQLGKRIRAAVHGGQLLDDSVVLPILWRRLDHGKEVGERGFVLDGFPRTREQAAALQEREGTACTAVNLCAITALNLRLRSEALLAKCLGRRQCVECGKGFNVAHVELPADPAGSSPTARPAVCMPALPPPPECAHKLACRPDDTREVVVRRLEAHEAQAKPVEAFYRQAKALVDVELESGIETTTPRLLASLLRHAAPGCPVPPSWVAPPAGTDVAGRPGRCGKAGAAGKAQQLQPRAAAC